LCGEIHKLIFRRIELAAAHTWRHRIDSAILL
jgi:hypothetical protein